MITATTWNPAEKAELPGQGGTMRHVAIKAGHTAAKHHHDHEQFFFVASGNGLLACEQGSIPLTPGTAVHLPPGAWHSAEFTADTVLIEFNLA